MLPSHALFAMMLFLTILILRRGKIVFTVMVSAQRGSIGAVLVYQRRLFLSLKNSDKSFLCVSCRLNNHSSEINSLCTTVNHLTKELADLKSQMQSLIKSMDIPANSSPTSPPRARSSSPVAVSKSPWLP